MHLYEELFGTCTWNWKYNRKVEYKLCPWKELNYLLSETTLFCTLVFREKENVIGKRKIYTLDHYV